MHQDQPQSRRVTNHQIAADYPQSVEDLAEDLRPDPDETIANPAPRKQEPWKLSFNPSEDSFPLPVSKNMPII